MPVLLLLAQCSACTPHPHAVVVGGAGPAWLLMVLGEHVWLVAVAQASTLPHGQQQQRLLAGSAAVAGQWALAQRRRRRRLLRCAIARTTLCFPLAPVGRQAEQHACHHSHCTAPSTGRHPPRLLAWPRRRRAAAASPCYACCGGGTAVSRPHQFSDAATPSRMHELNMNGPRKHICSCAATMQPRKF